jgi:tRNA pseudouridine38-40 synthase
MNRAAEKLLGTQDFTSFSKLHTDVKTNICTVSEAKWYQLAENSWYFEIKADRFLRNMVRAVVGTLLEVGYGNLSGEEITRIIESKDRGEAKLSVPAKGLFLVDIQYPGFLRTKMD